MFGAGILLILYWVSENWRRDVWSDRSFGASDGGGFKKEAPRGFIAGIY